MTADVATGYAAGRVSPGNRHRPAADFRGRHFDPWSVAGDEPPAADHWLLSYVDILTLLLTLLVVLLVLQQSPDGSAAPPLPAPAAALSPVAASPAQSGGILPIRRGRNPGGRAAEPVLTGAPTASTLPVDLFQEMAEEQDGPPAPALAESAGQTATPPTPPPDPGSEPTPVPIARPHPLAPALERLLAGGLDGRIRASRVQEGISLEMGEKILFDPGSAELKAAGRRLLAELARHLAGGEGIISVEGHSDDRPIANGRFPSNWELSSGRAAAVSRFLIAAGLQARRMRVVGYGSTRPLESNATPAGRARNRRVSLVVHLRPTPDTAP
ncbi:MAG TPA: hypothetical protein ENK50_03820 [Sedimenticola sp.]|nr:hypothetical protein [Sedimenticola sp.]